MSIEAFRWAKDWELPRSNQKFVLVMLADYYNDEKKRAWPSLETLARQTCLSVSTVQRAIDFLKEAGLVEVEQWINADTQGALSNRYYLPMFDSRSTAARKKVPAFAGFGPDGVWEEEPVSAA